VRSSEKEDRIDGVAGISSDLEKRGEQSSVSDEKNPSDIETRSESSKAAVDNFEGDGGKAADGTRWNE
jgi:hypothetical protein